MKQQHEVDYNNPRERFPWAMRGMEFNGFPFLAPDQVFEDWSEHLSKAGFLHIDQIVALADPHGNVNVSMLPQQQIHYQPPTRGQDHVLNGAGRWIPMEEPIQPPLIPMVKQMTPQEQARMIEEFRAEGLID